MIEFPQGIQLARLPKKIFEYKLPFMFDLHSLGFSKLKNLLLTIPEVIIENPGTTFASAKLKRF